jgi:cytochrome P450
MATPELPFNPLDPAMAVDPYPRYRQLREREPVHLSQIGAYVLTRHADVVRMLRDNDTFQHQYVAQQRARVGPAVEEEPYFDAFRRMVFVLDNPDHRRIRKLLAAAFSPARTAALRPMVAAIAEDLVAQVSPSRRIELVADLCFPLPMRVIGALLGIPDADHFTIGRYATALNPVLEFLPMSPEVLKRANEAIGELEAYFRALASARRADPTDDLFSAMVHATDDGEVLTDEELIANAVLLYIAGHETTAGATALGLLALLRNPNQLALLRRQPELRRGAVEELLRYDSPGQGTARVVMTDTVFGDVPVAAGSFVLGYLGAANRDPAVFTDPDVLDITRDASRAATWGGGAHLCLGRSLAQQELDVALQTLLERCPGLELADEPVFRPTPLMRGLDRLDLRW